MVNKLQYISAGEKYLLARRLMFCTLGAGNAYLRSFYEGVYEERDVHMKQEERTELTRAKILDAAMEEFGKSGYNGGSINNICKRGIHKGLVYHNFKDKDELYILCVKKSCDHLVNYMEQVNAEESIEHYMSARMRFFREHRSEAYIFFEALLDTPEHLKEPVSESLKAFDDLNLRIYKKTISRLSLRPDVTDEDALHYFSLFQKMFNGYFCSPAFQNTDLETKVEAHETNIPRILDFFLYGIAERSETKSC